MINSNTLQHGNRVTVANDKTNSVRKVESVGYYDMVWLDHNFRTYFIKELQGIKITEQWLRNMGFEYEGGKDPETNTTTYHLGGVILVNFNATKHTITFKKGGAELSYVHELQNALLPRLSGLPV